jgi:aminoglycoside/choline kinase family phosphotransferase
LSFLPRMWGLLERDLAHPALAPVKGWFDANIPATHRHDALAHEA